MTDFSVQNLGLSLPSGKVLYDSVSFTISVDKRRPQTLVVRGPSGAGKTTLLKCLAHLVPFDAGKIELDGKTAADLGMPNWRARVLYVPQRSPQIPGTPRDLIRKIDSFAAQVRKGLPVHSPMDIASQWNLAEDAWDKEFNQLSGGTPKSALALSWRCRSLCLTRV
ncbi:hypothetical protein HKX48_000978 [Thoreauomyces humboldtii]|nr:hypothetical protein HKX48_000978 [Thoreauomyces humboldtii]